MAPDAPERFLAFRLRVGSAAQRDREPGRAQID